MNYITLGRARVEVSRLCLGTMNFGPRTTEADSFAIMERALEAGINFFDTANAYGGKAGKGATEAIVGRWLAQGGGRRERIVLATKVYSVTGDRVNEGRLSAYHIRRACEDSLRRLQTDHIDLYQMHHIDWAAPLDEIQQAMEKLVADGKVIYVGSSNFPGWHIAEYNMAARQRHSLGLVSEQCLYNLAERESELEVIPAAERFGMAILPYSPLAGGGLAGGVLDKKWPDESRRSGDYEQKRMARHRDKVERWEAHCRNIGAEPGNLALAWMMHKPGVTAPIIGPRTMEQLEGALAAAEMNLDAEAMKAIEDIWPGRGKAPEAYAW